ncbi:MAG: holo-ACP synthase [Clostridiaceae bacterium]|nr:holo-ACP synthase [Clostridiaceae bacterium]
MAILCGVDIVEIDRVKRAIDKRGQAFLGKAFTLREVEYCEEKRVGKYHSYSARFAAKEAVAKALGTGIGKGAGLKDIEILNDESGKPYVFLSGKFREYFVSLNGKSISLSMSHCKNYAVAFAIVETS